MEKKLVGLTYIVDFQLKKNKLIDLTKLAIECKEFGSEYEPESSLSFKAVHFKIDKLDMMVFKSGKVRIFTQSLPDEKEFIRLLDHLFSTKVKLCLFSP